MEPRCSGRSFAVAETARLEVLTTIRAGETGNSAHGYPRRCSAPANAMDTVAIGGRQTSVPALEAVQTAEYVLASPEWHSRMLVSRN